MGIAALILGLMGIVAVIFLSGGFIPGFLLSIPATIFGAKGKNGSNPGIAKAGWILGIIGLFLSVIRLVLVVLLFLDGGFQ